MKAIRVPVEHQKNIELVEVTGWESMAKAIGRGCSYIEKCNCVLTPDHSLVMVLDEDGLAHKQPHNTRAQMLYPFSRIVGDALVMRMDYVEDGLDFVELPDPTEAMRLVKMAIE